MLKKILQLQKLGLVVALAACLAMSGCHTALQAEQGTWQQTLPNTGVVATLEGNGLETGTGRYTDENGVTNEYLMISTEVSPTLTLQGVHDPQVKLLFAAPPEEPGDSFTPEDPSIIAFDYILMEGEDGVSYRLDTVFPYLVVVEKDGNRDCFLIQIKGREAYL